MVSTCFLMLSSSEAKSKPPDRLLQREKESLAMTRPTRRDFNSLVNWLWGEKPIVQAEMQFLNAQDDFVSLMEEQDSYFQIFIEWLLKTAPFSWFKVSGEKF
jgi:hypothetical protein